MTPRPNLRLTQLDAHERALGDCPELPRDTPVSPVGWVRLLVVVSGGLFFVALIWIVMRLLWEG